jgi:hypothetical protein
LMEISHLGLSIPRSLTLCVMADWGSLHLFSSSAEGTSFFFLIYFFLLGIFLIYISNAIPKVPHTHPPPSPTLPLPLFGPGIPLYWGI